MFLHTGCRAVGFCCQNLFAKGMRRCNSALSCLPSNEIGNFIRASRFCIDAAARALIVILPAVHRTGCCLTDYNLTLAVGMRNGAVVRADVTDHIRFVVVFVCRFAILKSARANLPVLFAVTCDPFAKAMRGCGDKKFSLGCGILFEIEIALASGATVMCFHTCQKLGRGMGCGNLVNGVSKGVCLKIAVLCVTGSTYCFLRAGSLAARAIIGLLVLYCTLAGTGVRAVTVRRPCAKVVCIGINRKNELLISSFGFFFVEIPLASRATVMCLHTVLYAGCFHPVDLFAKGVLLESAITYVARRAYRFLRASSLTAGAVTVFFVFIVVNAGACVGVGTVTIRYPAPPRMCREIDGNNECFLGGLILFRVKICVTNVALIMRFHTRCATSSILLLKQVVVIVCDLSRVVTNVTAGVTVVVVRVILIILCIFANFAFVPVFICVGGPIIAHIVIGDISGARAKLALTVVLRIGGIPRFHIVIVRSFAVFATGVTIAITGIVVVVRVLTRVVVTDGAFLPVMGFVCIVAPIRGGVLFQLIVYVAALHGAKMCMAFFCLVAPVFEVEMMISKNCARVVLVIGACIIACACRATGAIEPINVCFLAIIGLCLVVRRSLELFAVIVTERRNDNSCGICDLLYCLGIGEHLAATGCADVIFNVAVLGTGSSLCRNTDNGMAKSCLVNVVALGAGAGSVFGSGRPLCMAGGIDIIPTSFNGATICMSVLADGRKLIGIIVIAAVIFRCKPKRVTNYVASFTQIPIRIIFLTIATLGAQCFIVFVLVCKFVSQGSTVLKVCAIGEISANAGHIVKLRSGAGCVGFLVTGMNDLLVIYARVRSGGGDCAYLDRKHNACRVNTRFKVALVGNANGYGGRIASLTVTGQYTVGLAGQPCGAFPFNCKGIVSATANNEVAQIEAVINTRKSCGKRKNRQRGKSLISYNDLFLFARKALVINRLYTNVISAYEKQLSLVKIIPISIFCALVFQRTVDEVNPRDLSIALCLGGIDTNYVRSRRARGDGEELCGAIAACIGIVFGDFERFAEPIGIDNDIARCILDHLGGNTLTADGIGFSPVKACQLFVSIVINIDFGDLFTHVYGSCIGKSRCRVRNR